MFGTVAITRGARALDPANENGDWDLLGNVECYNPGLDGLSEDAKKPITVSIPPMSRLRFLIDLAS